MIEIDGIKELIPHRDPFLLVDRIVSIDNDIPLILGEKDINLSLDFFNIGIKIHVFPRSVKNLAKLWLP